MLALYKTIGRSGAVIGFCGGIPAAAGVLLCISMIEPDARSGRDSAAETDAQRQKRPMVLYNASISDSFETVYLVTFRSTVAYSV